MPPATSGAYLDHAASSPTRPEAVAAMLPWLVDGAANPTGAHGAARRGRRAIEEAREVVAGALGVAPGEVVFTSGGTESDNLAVASASGDRPGRMLVSAVEHPAVAVPAAARGAAFVPVDRRGVLDVAWLEAHAGPDVSFVSVMAVNNELGTIQPLARVAEVLATRAPDAVLHTDAVQAPAWLDLRPLGGVVHAMSVSAHKVGGPVGVGALAWRAPRPLRPLLVGGGPERGRRAGTPNVAGIVGFAAALSAAVEDRAAVVDRVGRLRDRLVAGILGRVQGVETTVEDGDRAHKVAGNAHLCFPGVESEALLFLLDDAGVAASAASSCSSGAQQASPVLAAVGLDDDLGRGSLRLTLGWSTTTAEVDHAVDAVVGAVRRLRETGS